MKVLFLANNYKIGTAYTHRLARLREALDGHGIETGLINLRDERVGRPIVAHRLNVPALVGRVTGYDFIHAGEEATYTAVALTPRTGARTIHDVHGDAIGEAKLRWETERSPYSLYWLTQSMIVSGPAFRRADFSLIVSEPARVWITQEKGVRPETVALVRNGVDLVRFAPSPLPGTSPMTFCYAGGFQHWQGIHNLIDAFEMVGRTDVRLRLIGFTPGQADLRRSVMERLGDRVEIMDRMPQEDLVRALAESHVLVIPRSRHQAVETAFPTKYGEYCAMGRPVLVTDADETAPLTRANANGTVAQPTPQSIAEQIEHMAGLTHAELTAMGGRGRALAEAEFSWDVVGTRYAEALERWSRMP